MTFYRLHEHHFKILLKKGKCRQEGCKMNLKFIPIDSTCLGNNGYNTMSA